MSNNKNTHGGSRGGGRKPSENPKQNITFRLSQDVILFLKGLPNRTVFLENLIRESIKKEQDEKSND